MLELYSRIKHCRENLQMSQDELAKKVGYKSRTSIHKIEQGKIDIPQSKIVEIAHALDTTPEYLMGWTELTAKQINEEETKLVDDYRLLNADGKDFLWNVIHLLLNSSDKTSAKSSIVQHNKHGNNYGVVSGNFNSNLTLG